MAKLKIQQKGKLVEMLSKYYTLDNEKGIKDFIESIASDNADKMDYSLELTLMAYSLMGKEKTQKVDNEFKLVRVHFNPYPAKLCVVKALKETPELNLCLKEAKEIVDGQQITIDSKLLEKVKTAIFDAGGNVISIEEL